MYLLKLYENILKYYKLDLIKVFLIPQTFIDMINYLGEEPYRSSLATYIWNHYFEKMQHYLCHQCKEFFTATGNETWYQHKTPSPSYQLRLFLRQINSANYLENIF